MKRALLIAGPTASGKSAVALKLADAAVDAAGAIYVAGETDSTDFPVQSAYQAVRLVDDARQVGEAEEGLQTFEDGLNHAVNDGALPAEFRPPPNAL